MAAKPCGLPLNRCGSRLTSYKATFDDLSAVVERIGDLAENQENEPAQIAFASRPTPSAPKCASGPPMNFPCNAMATGSMLKNGSVDSRQAGLGQLYVCNPPEAGINSDYPAAQGRKVPLGC